jgi:hypothetical protein
MVIAGVTGGNKYLFSRTNYRFIIQKTPGICPVPEKNEGRIKILGEVWNNSLSIFQFLRRNFEKILLLKLIEKSG